jgi:hypothetical protein
MEYQQQLVVEIGAAGGDSDRPHLPCAVPGNESIGVVDSDGCG